VTDISPEQTNPRPLEKFLEEDPRIRSAMIFGRGKFNCGLLVQPALDFLLDTEDESKVESFKEMIWPTVQKANLRAPSHSRLFKEMILFASQAKPFVYNSKGSAKREFMLTKYEDEIKNLYDSANEISEEETPDAWNAPSTIDFVRHSVQNVMGTAKVTDNEDIFNNGCDR